MNRIKNAAWSVAAFLLAALLTPLVVLWVYVVGPTDDGTDWPEDDEGPCPTCSGWTRYQGDDKVCPTCDQTGRVRL